MTTAPIHILNFINVLGGTYSFGYAQKQVPRIAVLCAGSADTALRQKDRKGTAIFRREAVYMPPRFRGAYFPAYAPGNRLSASAILKTGIVTEKRPLPFA